MIHYLTIFTLPTESRKGIRKRRKATKTEKKLEFFKPCTRTASYREPGESVMSLWARPFTRTRAAPSITNSLRTRDSTIGAEGRRTRENKSLSVFLAACAVSSPYPPADHPVCCSSTRVEAAVHTPKQHSSFSCVFSQLCLSFRRALAIFEYSLLQWKLYKPLVSTCIYIYGRISRATAFYRNQEQSFRA